MTEKAPSTTRYCQDFPWADLREALVDPDISLNWFTDSEDIYGHESVAQKNPNKRETVKPNLVFRSYPRSWACSVFKIDRNHSR